MSQRDNENALQVQDSLEKEVTGGVSSFSALRTVLSFIAVAYDLMRRVSVDDIQFLGKSENGRVLLRFARTIQKMIGDDGLYLWRDVEGLGEENVPAETLDEVRRQAHAEVLEKLTLADLPCCSDGLREALLDQARDQVAEAVKQEVIDEAVSEAMSGVLSSVQGAADSWASDIDDKKSCVSGQLGDAISHLDELAVGELLDALNNFSESLSEARNAVESAQSDVDNMECRTWCATSSTTWTSEPCS